MTTKKSVFLKTVFGLAMLLNSKDRLEAAVSFEEAARVLRQPQLPHVNNSHPNHKVVFLRQRRRTFLN